MLKKKRSFPKLNEARLILGFSGWMDGGAVSTGALEYLIERLDAVEIAEIDPSRFFLYSFPGSMEVAALFRPEIVIEGGLVRSLEEPSCTFHVDETNGLVFFLGREPNFHWETFAECILSVAAELNVSMIHFIGSVASAVPHTRATRYMGSVSGEHLLPLLRTHGICPSYYAGPGSFVTYLTTRASERKLDMLNLVAEIPAYTEGRNVKCILEATRKLCSMLNLSLETQDLAALSEEFEQRIDAIVKGRPDLAEFVARIEAEYDKETLDSQRPDLRDWFKRQSIRAD